MKFSPALYYKLAIGFWLIFLIIVLLFVLDMLYLFYKDLKKPNVDLYQYKITNFFYTYFIMYIYIFCFVFLIFYLRILYLDNPADLKILYYYIKTFIIYFLTLPIYFQLYFFVFIISCLLIFLFSFAIFHSISFREFFKFHVFYHFIHVFNSEYDTSLLSLTYTSFIDGLHYKTGHVNIISGIFMHFVYKFERYYSLQHYDIYAFFHYIFVNKYYKFLFKISPFIFLVYDSIFHNYVLQSFVYYMLIYTPLIIINRIADCVTPCNEYLVKLIQNLYYKTPNNVYFCVPLNFYPIMIESRLLHGLKINFDLDMPEDEFNSIFLLTNSTFKQDPNNIDMISNLEGITLIKYPGGKFYRLEFEYEEGKYDLGEEWILLQHHSNNYYFNRVS